MVVSSAASAVNMAWLSAGQLLPLFEACLPVMRTDIQVNRFLLPYLLQDVISFGSEEAVSGEQWLIN